MAIPLKDISGPGGGEIAGIRERDVRVTDTVNQMAVSLKETAGLAESVAGSAEELASSVNEMAASIEQVTGSAANLAATANQTAVSIEESSASIRSVTDDGPGDGGIGATGDFIDE